MKIYKTSRSLFDDWNEKHKEISKKIKTLKQKRDEAKTDNEHDAIAYELNELFVKSNLIHNFLADLGPLVYNEEERTK